MVIDDELMAAAIETTGLKTKKAVIAEALRTLVRLKAQERVRALRGKLRWEGDLDVLREGRFETRQVRVWSVAVPAISRRITTRIT